MAVRDLEQAPWDPANTLLGETTAELAAQKVQTPHGERLAVTVRTDSATVTVFLAKGNALDWGTTITTTAQGMAGNGLLAGIMAP